MGRIEDALKRAAERGAQSDPPDSVQEEAAEAPFVSPWHAADPRPEAASPPRLRARAKLVSGDRPRSSLRVYPESAAPSLQLDSQLAMGWPQPFAPDVDGKLVVMRSVDAAAVGEYRKLAETVRQAQADRGVKIVMVASAIVGEGKTLTAVNLALTLRQANGRVLLVDADIRGRRIHQLFQVSAGSGLAGCLTATDYGTLPVVDVMPNLTLLPAGSLAIEPSALGSPAMRRLLDDASQRFDWIVIDSPPAVSVPEAGLLAGLVDAAILVIQADRTSQGEVTQALETIGHSRIIGAVLNRASKKAMAEEAASRLVS